MLFFVYTLTKNIWRWDLLHSASLCRDRVPRIIPDCKHFRKVRSYFLWCRRVCCLSDFFACLTFVAVAEVVVHCLCDFSLVPDLLILFSHSLCLHPLTSYIIFPLAVFASTHVFVRSVFVSTLLVSALLACVTSTSLCLSSVSLSTLLVRTLCVYVNSLCLCPLSLSASYVTFCPLYVFVPTMCLCPPSCCLSAHSGVHSVWKCSLCHSYVSVSAAHSLISNPLCCCPLSD